MSVTSYETYVKYCSTLSYIYPNITTSKTYRIQIWNQVLFVENPALNLFFFSCAMGVSP